MKLEEMGKFLVQLPSFVSRFQIQSGERYLLCLEVPLCIAECQTGEGGVRSAGIRGPWTSTDTGTALFLWWRALQSQVFPEKPKAQADAPAQQEFPHPQLLRASRRIRPCRLWTPGGMKKPFPPHPSAAGWGAGQPSPHRCCTSRALAAPLLPQASCPAKGQKSSPLAASELWDVLSWAAGAGP